MDVPSYAHWGFWLFLQAVANVAGPATAGLPEEEQRLLASLSQSQQGLAPVALADLAQILDS